MERDYLEAELQKLITEFRKSKDAMVTCGDMADALYNILDDVSAEDVVADLALDMAPGI